MRSDGPALALLDDHRVKAGAGERPGGEGAAGAGADHDDHVADLGSSPATPPLVSGSASSLRS